jgi:oligosaccharyltransferase complex subunit epsilon
MAPKKNAREATPSAAATTTTSQTSTTAFVPPALASSSPAAANWDKVLANIYSYYMNETPQRMKLLDFFLVFLAVVGGLQFLYCILAGNFVRTMSPPSLSFAASKLTRPEQPFNAFLSGFSATVGQFVLTSMTPFPRLRPTLLTNANAKQPVSLRIQTTESNKSEFPKVSPERYEPHDT